MYTHTRTDLLFSEFLVHVEGGLVFKKNNIQLFAGMLLDNEHYILKTLWQNV